MFSVDECDDTLANWASLDKADILSADKDFFSYQGDPTLASRIFRDFNYDSDKKLYLVKGYPPKDLKEIKLN